jgi:hypothetical protein
MIKLDWEDEHGRQILVGAGPSAKDNRYQLLEEFTN